MYRGTLELRPEERGQDDDLYKRQKCFRTLSFTSSPNDGRNEYLRCCCEDSLSDRRDTKLAQVQYRQLNKSMSLPQM